MHDIKHLYELQETDLDITDRESKIAAVESDLADESAITVTRIELQKITEHLNKLGVMRREYERTANSVNEILQKIEGRLYSGTVTNPKELSAADEERVFAQARSRETEEKLLEVLLEIEGLEGDQSRVRGKLEKLQAERLSIIVSLEDRKSHLSKELADLQRRRDDLASRIPPQTTILYNSLRTSKNGYAVAKVEGGSCQGCRLTLSTGELQKARSSHKIVQCSSCRRILYAV